MFLGGLASSTQPLFFPNSGPARLSETDSAHETDSQPIQEHNSLERPSQNQGSSLKKSSQDPKGYLVLGTLLTGFQNAPLKSGTLRQELSSASLSTAFRIGTYGTIEGGVSTHSAHPFVSYSR